MTDGQCYMVIVGIETGLILAAWWAWKRIRIHRARTEWIRQLEQRRRRRPRRVA